ncbi:MAG: penicillin-binding protein 2 [Phycisphaerales bacterium]|nr:penicillin-binding protein 2 [Phycisphaerales bacterium]
MKSDARIRAWTRGVVIGTIAALGLTLVRVAQLKTMPPGELDPAMGSRTSTSAELAARGRILDRRGRVLATSVVGHRLFVDPVTLFRKGKEKIRKGLVIDPQARIISDPFHDAAEGIGSALGRSSEEIERILRSRCDDRYVVLDPDLSESELDAVRALDLDGLGIETKPVREYPQGTVAAGIVGKVGFEHTGLAGVELAFEKQLAASDGKLTFLRDVQRNVLHIDDEQFVPADDGDDVRLSIDLVLQDISERRLAEAVRQYNAGGGRLVAFDPATGDVLAMVDILRRRQGWAEVTDDPSRRIHPALGRNRNITDPYEPGSTFKPFVWAAATECGVFRPESRVPTPTNGPYRTGFGRAIRDVKYYGPVSWKTVLVKSLNSGMAIAGERMTFEQMQSRVVDRFGFGTMTHLGLPGETAGLVTSPEAWSKYTQTSVAMGHEIAVTPMQMVRAFSAFCNGGSMSTPRIVLTMGPDGRVIPSPKIPVISPEIALETRSAMEGVFTEGTGRKAQSALYRMFGKSGTAQLPRPDGQGTGYFDDRYVASFIAGAPYDHPRIVVLCVIDDPDRKRGHFGGSIAGPVVRDVIDESLQYLGVRPDQLPSRRNTILASGSDLPTDAKERVAAALDLTSDLDDGDLAAESSPDAPSTGQPSRVPPRRLTSGTSVTSAPTGSVRPVSRATPR